MFLPFHPTPHSTVNINVSAVSQAVQVYPEGGPISIRVMNNGTQTVWISYGDSNVVAATASSVPIGAGAAEVFTFDNTGLGPLYVAAVAAGTTGNIYFTPGRGA